MRDLNFPHPPGHDRTCPPCAPSRCRTLPHVARHGRRRGPRVRVRPPPAPAEPTRPTRAVVPSPAACVQTILADAHAQYRAGNVVATRAFLCLLTLPAQSPADLWQGLGHLRYALGQYEPAGVAYGYAAAYRPRDASLQARLALTCLALGDLSSFHAYRRRALTLDPRNLAARQLLHRQP